MGRMKSVFWFILLTGMLVAFNGNLAGINNKSKQFQKLARDWCQLLTASQIIPLYPLTQDIQPGDVMLVTSPIENQREEYKANGYLKLDQLLFRMHPSIEDYRVFYNGRFAYESLGENTKPDANDYEAIQWNEMPLAYFPTYSFAVSTSTSAGLALPVQSVSLAMSLSRTNKATGSLSIHKAHTYGIYNKQLYDSLMVWALDNRTFLQNYEPRTQRSIWGRKSSFTYLRVISRIYAIDSLYVTLTNTDHSKSDLNNESGTSAANMAGFASNLVTEITKINPRVSVVTDATRTIMMKEAFPEPVIVGYIGFDIPILEGGYLGAPISTLNQLKGNPQIFTANITKAPKFSLLFLRDVYERLIENSDVTSENVSKELDALADQIPEKYSVNVYIISNQQLVPQTGKNMSNSVARANFDNFITYACDMEQNCTNLSKYNQQGSDEYSKSMKEFDRLMSILQNSRYVHEAIHNVLYE